MPENRYLDTFTSGIKESDYIVDSEMKQKILNKTHRKIRDWMFYLKRITVACIILAALSAFIPETPVNALCQKLFSFIPGIGIVQNSDETGLVKGVLDKPVKIVEGEQFVEIKSAYITDKTLRMSIKTNVGAVDAGEFTDVTEFKKFFAGETAPGIYLLSGNEKIKSSHSSWGGPSFETRVYSIDTNFYLGDAFIDKQVFKLELEGFNRVIEIALSPVNSGTTPETMGNVAIIDNVMVFVNINRQGDVLEVLLSSVAPEDYKDIRFHLFDHENQLFKSSIHIVDKDGNTYEPNDEMRKQNNSSMDNYYFVIPHDIHGLKLIVPQILYNKRNYENDIKITMPKLGKEQKINIELDLSGSLILIEKASIIPSNDPLLPEEFKKYDCLKIDASAKVNNNARETVCRVIPNVEVPDGVFGYVMTSQSVNSELWDSNQRGYSLTVFEKMETTKKILLKFDVEYAMTGPWEFKIQ